MAGSTNPTRRNDIRVRDMDWKPVDNCPYQTVVWVKNDLMKRPVKATRGYVTNGAVHKDSTFFTTVYTPDRFFPTPAGLLVCPTHYAEIDQETPNDRPD